MDASNTDPTDRPSDQPDLQQVIDLVLQQEKQRKERSQRRLEKRRQKELKRHRLKDERLHSAIQVIKWCVVGMCSVMMLTMVIGVWALLQVEKAVAEVETDVEQVTARVENILHEVEHPFEGAGRLLGRDVDQSVAEFFGLKPTGKTD